MNKSEKNKCTFFFKEPNLVQDSDPRSTSTSEEEQPGWSDAGLHPQPESSPSRKLVNPQQVLRQAAFTRPTPVTKTPSTPRRWTRVSVAAWEI